MRNSLGCEKGHSVMQLESYLIMILYDFALQMHRNAAERQHGKSNNIDVHGGYRGDGISGMYGE